MHSRTGIKLPTKSAQRWIVAGTAHVSSSRSRGAMVPAVPCSWGPSADCAHSPPQGHGVPRIPAPPDRPDVSGRPSSRATMVRKARGDCTAPVVSLPPAVTSTPPSPTSEIRHGFPGSHAIIVGAAARRAVRLHQRVGPHVSVRGDSLALESHCAVMSEIQ